MVIIIQIQLNLGVRDLKIASRANFESGPRLAEVCSQSINCGTNIWILSVLALFTIMWTMLLLTPLVTWKFEHDLLWSKFWVFKFYLTRKEQILQTFGSVNLAVGPCSILHCPIRSDREGCSFQIHPPGQVRQDSSGNQGLIWRINKDARRNNNAIRFVTRPLCLVESHTLDAAARQERSLFTSLTFC